MIDRSDSSDRGRLDAVRRGLREHGAVVAVFGLSSNLRYLTGFTDEPGERALLLLVAAEGEVWMVVPELYVAEVTAHSPPATVLPWADGDDPMRIVRRIADGLRERTGRVLVDDALWAAFLLPLQAAFGGRAFGLTSDVMTSLRACKATDEVAAMRRAGGIADRALESALSEPIVGLTELQLAGRLEAAMLARGANGIAFETLVASGPNGALPHHRAGARTIEPGDVVILDYGCRVDGYCSDITRTVACGPASPRVEAVHDAVLRAHDAAIERAAIGTPAEAVDRAAREVLTAAGYGPNFVHRTGHGVGLDIHESPYIVEGNRKNLQAGMAFSVEPGAYFAEEFGVRIEDVVVVGENGAVSMTMAPRELRRVD